MRSLDKAAESQEVHPTMSNGAVLVSAGTGLLAGVLALELARSGARIVLHHGHSEAEAARGIVSRLADEGACLMTVAGDLRSVPEIERFVEGLRDRVGPIDGFVSGYCLKAESVTHRAWVETCAAGMKRPFFLARPILLDMTTRKRGRVVFVAAVPVEASGYPSVLGQVVHRCTASMAGVLARAVAPAVEVNSILTNGELIGEDSTLTTGLGALGAGKPGEIARMVRAVMSGTFPATGLALEC